MRRAGGTKALYAGSLDPITRGASSSTAKELAAVGEAIGWLVMPSVEALFAAKRR